MALFELPAPPAQAPVVDGNRRITVPWKEWIIDWLALLQNAINAAIASLSGVAVLSEITVDSTAGSIALVGSAAVHLGRARRGGRLTIAGSFAPSQVGAPVVAQIFPSREDESEGLLTCARAIVLDERTLRVYWSASSPLSGAAVVHFAIGGQQA